MRHSYSVATGVLFAALLLPQPLQATGNVLVPRDDTGNASSAPNLGISVLPPTSAPAPVAEPVIQPEAPVPAPIVMPPKKENPPTPSSPPRIITETEAPAQMGTDLPKSLSISMSNKSSFGPGDIAKITDKLGLGSEQISSSCILTVRGMIKTNKSMYTVPLRASSYSRVDYDGTITVYLMTAQALCLVNGALPQKGGVIVKMGDRFIIPLQQINCAAPNGKADTLVITYDGSGKSQCAYQ